jgi:hypothetical protein
MTQKEIIMDNKTEKYLWALRKVNEALIEALKIGSFSACQNRVRSRLKGPG